jgi:hypothetical protein
MAEQDDGQRKPNKRPKENKRQPEKGHVAKVQSFLRLLFHFGLLILFARKVL